MYKPEDMEVPSSFDYGDVEASASHQVGARRQGIGEAQINSQNAFAVSEEKFLKHAL